MNFYIGNTDYDWYTYLREHNNPSSPEDINFWRPGGQSQFKAINRDEPFLFRLKAPYNAIAGVAFFSRYVCLPLNYVWEVFGHQNGADTFSAFKRKIDIYRGHKSSTADPNPEIGCIVLSNPVFFKREDWIGNSSDWRPTIVQGKTYDAGKGIGAPIWDNVLQSIRLSGSTSLLSTDQPVSPQYNYGIQKIRVGQGAFRVNVTESYSRRCAISGERTLPVLQAAHIKSYSEAGPNDTSNGLLLRSDLHTLYDKGYLAITEDYRVEISPRLHEEFSNGRDYYKYHGQKLLILPDNQSDYPCKEFLRWHNEQYFR